jgi:hypothetical protein
MIRKSGNRFSDKIMLKTENLDSDPTGLDHGPEHDPEKWKSDGVSKSARLHVLQRRHVPSLIVLLRRLG